MMEPIRRVLERLQAVRETSTGWLTRCPAHDDRTPSLSVAKGQNGRALLTCYAGCDTEAIIEALGLSWNDLFPDDDRSDGGSPLQSTEQFQLSCHSRSEQNKGLSREEVENWCRTLLDDDTHLARKARMYLVEHRGIDSELLRRRHVGLRFDKLWWIVFPLEAEAGCVTLAKERGFDPETMDWKRDRRGKPYVRTQGGSSLSFLACDDASGPILLCEGETDAFSARSNGFDVAFGTAGAATFKQEWAEQVAIHPAAAERGVVVCYDGDDAGRDGAQKAAQLLSETGVKVRIGDLPDGRDVNDVITAEGPERLREIVGDAIPYTPGPENKEKVKVSATTATRNLPGNWCSFPVDALPGPAAEYVRASATAVGCADAMVALPVLSVLSAAIGGAARLHLKRTWKEPAGVWTMLVAPSGSAKSPALKQALRPVYHRERQAEVEFERALRQWKSSDEADEHSRPRRRRYRTGDATTESIMKLLSRNPRGLLLTRNEMGAWLGSFDRYVQGNADLQFWTEVWDSGQVSRDRAGDGNVTVDNPVVPVTGTIQPGTLKEKLKTEHFESGFAARFLLVSPPIETMQWTEEDVTQETESAFQELLSGLYALPMETEVCFDEEAKQLWIEFYNRTHREIDRHLEEGPVRSVAIKSISYAARLTLLTHLGRKAAGKTTSEVCEAESVRRGLRLARWLRRETTRVYEHLDLAASVRPPYLQFFDVLPQHFETKKAKELGEERGVPTRTCEEWLARLTKQGYLRKPQRGLYTKR